MDGTVDVEVKGRQWEMVEILERGAEGRVQFGRRWSDSRRYAGSKEEQHCALCSDGVENLE